MSSIGRLSRFRFCQSIQRPGGRMMLTDREPFRFVDYADNRRHIAKSGDTWWNIAARYFRAPGMIERPADLWWVIADFQPQPVVDPTLRIEPGTVIFIPSFDTLFLRIFSEDRRVGHR